MKKKNGLLQELLTALQLLPGIGPKSAQRLAFYLLARKRDSGLRLAKALEQAMQSLGHCLRCRNFSEEEVCSLCSDGSRNDQLLCVVENPNDLYSLEALGQYQGRYFVLLGRLSPLEGILPEALGMDRLAEYLEQSKPKEVILAMNPTVEGELTAQYIASFCSALGIVCSRMAHGMPVGGELEYLDKLTLSYAFCGRQPFTSLSVEPAAMPRNR